MTPSTQEGRAAARNALEKSVSDNRQQVELTDESRRLLKDMLRDEMGEAFARGLREAMTSENARVFVRAMLTEAQSMATEKSVEVAGGVIKALFKRALMFLLLGSIVYSLGGWTALAALGKFLSNKG